MSELKNSITPIRTDKTLQERLNEVCQKHGVSTLQDLDRAFCESEKSYTKDRIEVANRICHHKHKRCLAMASYWLAVSYQCVDGRHRNIAEKRHHKWLKLAENFKEYDNGLG